MDNAPYHNALSLHSAPTASCTTVHFFSAKW
jgi:hypothetical protein